MSPSFPGPLDEGLVRGWLANLGRPEILADASMRALLRAHGRAAPASPLDAGRAATQLIVDAVEALASHANPPLLPYRVLRTCFLEGLKNRQAAARLGLSERQLTRERTRAIRLLAAQLGTTAGGAAEGPPPTPTPFLVRPHLDRALTDALASARRVSVVGPAGCGKTALVASLASSTPARVFWHRVAPGAVARLPALLFELGEHAAQDDPALAAYVRATLPAIDDALATRIALAALGPKPRLIVIDGSGRLDHALDAFLDELVSRLPAAQVVVTGGGARGPAGVRVPPFSPRETRALLALAGVEPDERFVAALHTWTGGNVRLIARAARWLAAPATARSSLDDALRQRGLLLPNLRGLRRAATRTAA